MTSKFQTWRRRKPISLRLQCLGYAQVGGEIEDLAFLCRSTQLPDMTIGVVNVPLDRNIKIAGDRTIGECQLLVTMTQTLS